MNTHINVAAPGTSREFRISREFDAPRALVWKVWTDSEHLARWWGPKGFTMIATKLDLRAGGLFHYGMRAPNDMEMWGKFVFREVTAPERLVYVVSFSDPEAGTTRHFASQTWPLEMLNTVVFEALGDRTRITLTGVAINADENEIKTFEEGFESMNQGFSGTLGQLAEYLAELRAA